MNIEADTHLVVITGGPGMGKTSVIERLAALGYVCLPESGRNIIRSQLEAGGTNLPWMNREGYAEAMFNQALSDYHATVAGGIGAFFDRGLPDTIGYLTLCGLPVPRVMRKAAEQYRYFPKVFITPPWEAIYRRDEERKQSFAEAIATYNVMIETYEELGYALVELPKQSVEERVEFILRSLSAP